MTQNALRFEQIQILQMPGFESEGFTAANLQPGLNLISGPNGVGKTTLARAMRALLWPDKALDQAVLRATATIRDQRWILSLSSGKRSYLQDGEASQPPSLPGGWPARYHLALTELMAATDADFARQLSEESAGGYSLADAASALQARDKPRATGPASRRLAAAREALKKQQQTQDRLRHETEQGQLPQLQAEQREAEAASRRSATLAAVQERRAAAADLAQAEADLQPFGEVVRRLTGEENKHLAEIEEGLTERRSEIQTASTDLAAARQILAEAKLPDDGVAETLLQTLRATASTADEQHQTLRAAKQRVIETGARWHAAAQEVAQRKVDPERIDALLAEGLPPLATWLRGEQELGARAQAIAHWETTFAAGEPIDAQSLRDSIARLERWLVAHAELARASWWQVLLIGTGALLVGFGAAMGVWYQPTGWFGPGLGGPLLLVGLLARLRSDPREVWQAEFAKHSPPLEPWTLAAVETRLTALREELRAAEYAAAMRSEARRYDPFREETATLRQRMERQRAELTAAYGLTTDAEPLLDLAQLHEALKQYRTARSDHIAAEGHLAEVNDSLQATLANLGAALAEFGYAPPTTAPLGREQLAELEQRARQHRQARLDEQRESERLDKAEQAVADGEQKLAELFCRLGLAAGDVAGLRRALAELDDYRAKKDRRLHAAIALKQIGELDEGEWADATDEQLCAEQAAAAERSARLTDLLREIGAVEQRLKTAEQGRQLEDALAEEADARRSLTAEREQDAGQMIAALLLETIRTEHQETELPAVLLGARERFSRLTGGAYRLDLTGDPEPRFRAFDTSAGQYRALDELSSGNRVQLLLSVRLASIELGEDDGPRLPIWFDEALATSDDQRTRALIESIADLAAEGRQVFYLTAQLDEVAKLRQAVPDANVIDLAAVRDLAAPAALLPEPVELPSIPTPAGLSRHEYGQRLAVRGLDPRQPIGAAHLFYGLSDLPTLHRLLSRHACFRWSMLKNLLETHGPAALELDAAVYRRCEVCFATLEQLCSDWRIGRGKPVDARVLSESPLGQSTLFSAVSGCAEAVDGDARRLIEEMIHLPGVGTGKQREMAEWLLEQGYLDEREPLARDALIERGCVAAAEWLRDELLTPADISWLAGCLPEVAQPATEASSTA